MKFKTYLFEFLISPNEENPKEVYIKAQNQGSSTMSDEGLQDAVRSIAGEHIPEMKPLEANPGKLVKTSEEDPPVEYFRVEHHPGIVAWESNERPQNVT